jgi:pimeloyl-ACP methyl ester carboxylesterase
MVNARPTLWRRGILVAVGCVAATGCYPFGAPLGTFALKSGCTPLAIRPLKDGESAVNSHAIFVTGEGTAVEPRANGCAKGMDSAEYGRYLAAIIDSIRADSARRGEAPKLLIRIHGGLNTLNGALSATSDMTREIEKDSSSGFYPLFVNWESGLISAYGEHMFLLRRGKRAPVADPFGGAFILTADLVSGFVRLPMTSTRQFFGVSGGWWRNNEAELTGESGAPSARPVIATAEQQLMVQQRKAVDSVQRTPGAKRGTPGGVEEHGNAIAVSRFSYHRSIPQFVAHNGIALALSFIPTRYFKAWGDRKGWNTSFAGSMRRSNRVGTQVLEALSWVPPKGLGLAVIDGLGSSAWFSMHRRASVMMRTADQFDRNGIRVDSYRKPNGALASFLDTLGAFTRRNPGYRISLVGHSMGAIVATEILRRNDSLPIDNLVFMASAATSREVESTVVPFMERNPKTEFYNLTLHPLADKRESHFFRIPPYGSLLEWIDSYFGHTETQLDLSSGKYDNLVRTALIYPAGIRGRIHIKAFGYNSGKGCGPHDMPFEHGQFNDPSVAYWRTNFWHPTQEGCEASRVRANTISQ